MPRYYFDLRDGDYLTPDEEGVTFPIWSPCKTRPPARLRIGHETPSERAARSERRAALVIEARDENGPVMRARFQFDIERLQEGPPQLTASRHPLQNVLPRYSNWLRSPPTQPFPASLD